MIQFGEHIFTPRPSVPSSLPAEFLDRDWPEPEVGVVKKPRRWREDFSILKKSEGLRVVPKNRFRMFYSDVLLSFFGFLLIVRRLRLC